MTRTASILLLSGAIILAFALIIGASSGIAAPLAQETQVPTAPAAQATSTVSNLSISDDYCLSCHGQPGQTLKLEDGTLLDLTVTAQDHNSSVHGSMGYACVQCHTTVGEYPHPAFSAVDRRDVTLKLTDVCERCHAYEYDLTQDSVHSTARSEGKIAAAVCVDCHTAHTVQRLINPATQETLPQARNQIPNTCAQCHYAIYQEYLNSVHGSALTDENNPDVPTCIDCHGVHNIENPTTAEFRLKSPKICAKCHTDPARMTKYGITTDVLNTYVADFHGTTVAIFEKQSPDAETNKPVCYDCHGVHNIQRADDPVKGLQVKENLLSTCQKCHPNAQDNFPTAWLSHYTPSPDKYPLVYYVNLFYKFFIPTVLGGMSILVVLDVSRLMINQRRRSKTSRHEEVQPPDQPAVETETPLDVADQPVQEATTSSEPAPMSEDQDNEETPHEDQVEPGEEVSND